MDEYGGFAETIAREAGALLKSRFTDRHTVGYKGEIDIVTEADLLSEELLKSRIGRQFPGHGIAAEESPESGRGSEFRWIIDPLDGTTNYAHGYPVYCVSIALEHRGLIELGVIYNPMLDEMFVSRRGCGAFLNGEKLSVSGTADLSRSLLATGFPYDIRESKDNNLNNFFAMAIRVQAIRRAGSAALDMAYVAAGRFDGFWELKLKPWDTAAGWLMIAEAGGKVTDLRGGAFQLASPAVLASNGRIHDGMLEIVRGAGSSPPCSGSAIP